MKILFICLSTLKFNVDTPETEPLGGTESAVCYLAKALVNLGHHVTLMRNTDDDADKVIDGVSHTKISEDIAKLDPDVVIVPSAPQAFPGIKALVPRAKLVLWNHMRPDQPAMAHLFNPEIKKDIQNIVYVSKSQEESFLSAPVTGLKGTVINNAIAPCFENMFTGPEDILAVKKCRGAYTSTPFRGLAILAHIKELMIEVYSSMRVYQGDDTAYEPMFAKLNESDCIVMQGSVSQKNLAAFLRSDAFLVYPSIFQECHSIAILEAMAAGMKVITTDMASPETEFIDAMKSEGGSLEDFTLLLRRNINKFRAHPQEWAALMWKQVQYINREFTWAKKAQEWTLYLQNILAKPT